MNDTVSTSSNGTSVVAPVKSIEQQIIFFIYQYVLLTQILFGSSGNVLNLIVLLSRKMRSRTNLLFALMAFADLSFLLIQTIHVLYVHDFVKKGAWYRDAQPYITGFANWFSALSIWCMLYATIERVQVLRNPFRAVSKRQISCRFVFTLLGICCVSLMLTSFHFIPRNTIMQLPKLFQDAMTWLNALFIVFLPCVISICLNLLLVHALKKHKFPTQKMAADDQSANRNLISTQSKNERKVTFMVVVILTSFIIFNFPGSVWYVAKMHGLAASMTAPRGKLIEVITNSLAITGKMLNFVLFCSSSSHFRAMLLCRCRELVRCVLRHRFHRNEQQSMEAFSRGHFVPSETIGEQISLYGNARTARNANRSRPHSGGHSPINDGSVMIERRTRTSISIHSMKNDNNNTHLPCRKISRSLPHPAFTVIVTEHGESLLVDDFDQNTLDISQICASL